MPYAGGGVDKVGGIVMAGAVHNSERPVDAPPNRRISILLPYTDPAQAPAELATGAVERVEG